MASLGSSSSVLQRGWRQAMGSPMTMMKSRYLTSSNQAVQTTNGPGIVPQSSTDSKDLTDSIAGLESISNNDDIINNTNSRLDQHSQQESNVDESEMNSELLKQYTHSNPDVIHVTDNEETHDRSRRNLGCLPETHNSPKAPTGTKLPIKDRRVEVDAADDHRHLGTYDSDRAQQHPSHLRVRSASGPGRSSSPTYNNRMHAGRYPADSDERLLRYNRTQGDQSTGWPPPGYPPTSHKQPPCGLPGVEDTASSHTLSENGHSSIHEPYACHYGDRHSTQSDEPLLQSHDSDMYGSDNALFYRAYYPDSRRDQAPQVSPYLAVGQPGETRAVARHPYIDSIPSVPSYPTPQYRIIPEDACDASSHQLASDCYDKPAQGAFDPYTGRPLPSRGACDPNSRRPYPVQGAFDPYIGRPHPSNSAYDPNTRRPYPYQGAFDQYTGRPYHPGTVDTLKQQRSIPADDLYRMYYSKPNYRTSPRYRALQDEEDLSRYCSLPNRSSAPSMELPCKYPGCQRSVTLPGLDGLCLHHYREMVYEDTRKARGSQPPAHVTCDREKEAGDSGDEAATVRHP